MSALWLVLAIVAMWVLLVLVCWALIRVGAGADEASRDDAPWPDDLRSALVEQNARMRAADLRED